MKARTKAQRRGRTRKYGTREPSGRPQRPSVAEIRSSTIEARMRQHGLTLAQAGDRLAGYEIGRLYLRRQIDLVDVEVCDDYVQTVARFMAITNPCHPFPKAMDYVATIRGLGGELSDQEIATVRSRYDVPNEFLTDAKNGVRDHLMAFHNVAFFDAPVGPRFKQIIAVLDALRKLNKRPKRERLVRAAILHDGKIWSVPAPGRHHHVILIMADAGLGPEAQRHQGFMTDTGRYVDRRDGLKIAEAADQIIRRTGNADDQLYSEGDYIFDRPIGESGVR